MVKCISTLQVHYPWDQVIFSCTSNGSLGGVKIDVAESTEKRTAVMAACYILINSY